MSVSSRFEPRLLGRSTSTKGLTLAFGRCSPWSSFSLSEAENGFLSSILRLTGETFILTPRECFAFSDLGTKRFEPGGAPNSSTWTLSIIDGDFVRSFLLFFDFFRGWERDLERRRLGDRDLDFRFGLFRRTISLLRSSDSELRLRRRDLVLSGLKVGVRPRRVFFFSSSFDFIRSRRPGIMGGGSGALSELTSIGLLLRLR